MDIKKQFEAALRDKSVRDFYNELQNEEVLFHQFENLQDFIDFMASRASCNEQLQDSSLLAIIRRIQAAEIQEGGLNLLTYLLAPGLQHILRDTFTNIHHLSENWLNLWWEFYQSIVNYPLSLRQRKVSANLLFETRHRITAEKKSESRRQNTTEKMGDFDIAAAEDAPSPYYELASVFLESAEDAGLDRIDKDIVISSRVYDASMKMLAKRWGLKYRTALQKRYRAEKTIREYWRHKHDENNGKDSAE